MTAVEFNPEVGQLRLPRAAFTELLAWHVAGGPEKPLPASLAAAGIVDADHSLHPAVAFGLDLAATPICRLDIDLRPAGGRRERGEGWVGGEGAALLLGLPDGRFEFGLVHVTFLPAMLVRVVGLGPRPRLTGGQRPVDPAVLDRLTGDPAGAAEAGLPGLTRDWRIEVGWESATGAPGSRGLRVLDTADGLWRVTVTDDRAVLHPTTPTEVWRDLLGLLPTDDELPQPPVDP